MVLLLLVLVISLPRSDAKKLTVLVQPLTSVAGEPLVLAPVVALTDDNGNILTTENTGTVRATIGVNPTRYATVQPTANQFAIVNGIAKCDGLIINTAATGYTLAIMSFTHGVRTETAAFDIIVGAPFQVAVGADISTAFGGTPFLPQPAVAVVDRGGNIVRSLNTGSATVEIIMNPVDGRLLPAQNLRALVVKGVATFSGLYIDRSGSPYALMYTVTGVDLPGGDFTVTNPFTVAAGACTDLVLQSSPTEATGGKAFSIQPVLKLIDAGGNVLLGDSTSYIRASIASNPSGGALTPADSVRAYVRRGVAIFRSLKIDRAGNDYALAFKLYTKVPGQSTWEETKIERVSPPFNVLVGRVPVTLFLLQPLSDGVLDGQPNEVQPQLELRDAGGNVVSSIMSGVVTASMVPSAAIASTVIVDTTTAQTLSVLSVQELSMAGYAKPYGVGMRISIEVAFSDEVIVFGEPTLVLASSSTGGPQGVAKCVTINKWSDRLVFQYDVVATDRATDMDYVSTTALSLSGGSITDRLNRVPSLTLPNPGGPGSLSVTSDISIDTTPPTITSVSCTAPGDGDYGAGEEIYIRVTFSTPVSVYGAPVLPVALATIGNGALRRDATFSSGNNTDTLVFQYAVLGGDATAVGGRLDVTSTIVLAADMYIKRFSTRPTTDVDLTMVTAPKNLASQNAITIDTSVPQVDVTVGVTAVSSNGVYTPGDSIDVALTFTKPVRVTGFPRLYLETGSIKRPAGYKSGDGTNRLVFSYTVAAYDSHSATGNAFLNYRDDNAVDLNGGLIRRLIRRGSQSADADISLAAVTAAGKSLKDNAQILLDCQPARIIGASIVLAPADTVQRGDVVQIAISFSSVVSVNTNKGVPSLALAVGDQNRQARYVSGTGTQALLFEYTVRLGDRAENGMDYRAANSLALNGAWIRKTSANPIMDADLTLPAPTVAMRTPPLIVSRTLGFVTTIISFSADVAAGEYGSNQVVTLTVEFADEVVVDGLPYLNLNTNARVPYITGSATSSLIFVYIVADGQSTVGLDKLNDDAIECDPPGCRIQNYNGELASLSLLNIDLLPAGIVIDTSPPVVVDVYAITRAPTVNGGVFVVGDVIDIIVEMSLEVYVDPPVKISPEKAPELVLTSGAFGRSVLCTGYHNGDRKKLLFQYTVVDGDVADDLMYVDEDSLTLNNGQSAIKRFSTTPKTDAILTLPPPVPLGQWQGETLKINTTKYPTVVSVTSTTPDGDYRCGDIIDLVVQFSQHVVVQGQPFLWLDLGAVYRKATYQSGSGTTSLIFRYVVQEDDYSVDLEYIDHHSLDASDVGSSILHLSSNPTTLANLDLPYPFTQNSLSFNKNLAINGRKPRVTQTRFVSADGVYGVNQKIVIEITFSWCVQVVPDPLTGSVPLLRFQPVPAGSTADIKRYGRYSSGSPGSSLRFEYSVRTGDAALDLDYADAESLVLNGAKILTCTADLIGNPPVQAVNTHLNPPGGKLLGAVTKQITFGRVAFTDLLVDRLGFEYQIIYKTQTGTATLEATNLFDVLYSATYGLRSTPYESGDMLGSSADIDGDTLVMGSPGAKEPISAVQIVTAVGDASEYVDEIQVIETKATQRPAVQEITSSAAPGETIGGWFFVKMGNIGPSRRLYYNFDEVQVRVAIELDLGFGSETIRVSRTENTYCGCSNGYIWTVTFLYAEGPLPALSTISALTGRLATVGDGRGANQARILVESTAIGGFYTLQLGSLVTRNIKFNAAEDELANILTQDLQLGVRRVLRSLPSAVGGYSWSVTFAASDQLYDVPELIPQTVGLQGYQARCQVRTDRNGLGRLSGVFRLRFRNDLFPADETDDISVTATDQQVEVALEKLVSINDVAVTRSTSVNAFGGYSWTVTFVQVNSKNDYGPVIDTSGNLPALVPVTSTTINGRLTTLLKGTNARVNVQVGGYELPPIVEGKTHWGLPGDFAGNAAVFVRAENDWKQQGGSLSGSDTRAGDRFGSSVSLKGDAVLIGAPSAALFGDYEIQNFVCDADGGFFRLIYRGKASDPIAFNAGPQMLRAAIVSIMSVNFADVDVMTPFTSACTNGGTQEISVALRSSDHTDTSGDIIDLVVDSTALTKMNGLASGTAQVRQYRAGTFRRAGEASKGIQVGAAYLFRRDPTTRMWSQQIKLTPPASFLFNAREYASAVALHDTFAAIGAPGSFEEEGRVFVYQYNAITSTWALFQILSAAPYDVTRGDRFGDSVAISGDPATTLSIAVGAPGYATSSGAVFVFDLLNSRFQNRQFILQVTPELKQGDRFGCSLDLDMTTTYTLVVGAKRNAYVGADSGTALVFTRRAASDTFFNLQQVLFASDARARDLFGTSVTVSKDTIIVGAHEEYKGPRTIRKAVQAVRTTARGGVISGGTFTLRMTKAENASIIRNWTVVQSSFDITSSPIPFNIDAASLRVRLENDFAFLGKILVKRLGPDASTGGNTWYITFAGSTGDVPLLEVDGRGLRMTKDVGTAIAMTEWTVRVPPVLRGSAYVFTRNTNGRWTEQATLYPREKQYFSWFGVAVALDKRTAIIGAPNLDTYETGINSGGGFVYDLGILSLGFSSKTYSVVEGSDVDIKVQRCSLNGAFCAMDVTASPRLFVNYDTGDAYSDLRGQNYVYVRPRVGPYAKMAQLSASPSSPLAFFAPFVAGQEPYPQIPLGRWLNANQVGTANGRNQYYGSTDRKSLWIDATFDYAGLSDYETASGELLFDVNDVALTFKVNTTSDFVLEDPDETVPLRLSLPGVWPSYDGNLWATLTIKDNGDGGSGARSYLDFLTAGQSSTAHQTDSLFGVSVSIFHDGNVAIVGAPMEKQVIQNQNNPIALWIGVHIPTKEWLLGA
ncbi:hypothetical protein PINS_up015470 [Pythium insidiosum]|nr:hypothetical protein PINS_up015470 [Pythium insidiosum]